jgi:trimeric autotransporter adhesin
MAYQGNVPAEAYTTTAKDTFNGNGSTTAFTLSLPTVTNDIRVVVENVVQEPTAAYSVSGTTLTFTAAPPSGTGNVYVVHLGPAVQTVEPPSTIAGATVFASNVTVQGNLTVDGGTIKLDGDYPVGTGNVALGDAALDSLTTGGYNTAVGSGALTSNTTGIENTANGFQALSYNTTGDNNTANGYRTLFYNTTGTQNTTNGMQALFLNTTASNNTAVGYQAGYYTTTANRLTAIGQFAGYGQATGAENTYVGYGSGPNTITNASGQFNTSLGAFSLQSNTTASYNTAVGYKAGENNTTGTQNVFVGVGAGQLNTSGSYNTYVGRGNGRAAGQDVTTGSKNTIIGGFNGNQDGLDIRTSSNNIVLSDGDGNPRVYVSSSGCVSIGTVSTTTDTVSRFGGSSSVFSQKMVNAYGGGTAIHAENTNNQGWIYARFNTNGSQVGYISVGTSSTSYVTSSDYRLKENVVYDWDATTRLKQLKPARFNFIVDADTTVDGFLAHEAQAVVPEAVHGTHNEVDADGVAVMQGIDQSKLVPLLVKTIQELEARITALEGN